MAKKSKKSAKKSSKKSTKKIKFNKGTPYEVEFTYIEPASSKLSSFGNFVVGLLKKLIGK